MCGRYTLRVPAERMASLFTLPQLPPEFAPRFNIAPTQTVPVVGLKPDGRTRGLTHLKWGLVPHWSNDPAGVKNTFNARAEGIEHKPTFGEPFRHKRCLLVMDGFYEWQPGTGRKTVPHHIRFPDQRPFAVAGLWDVWADDVTKLVTCAMVTVEANADVKPVHPRMPAVLEPDEYAAWLAPDTPERELKALLRPYQGGLEPVRVGPRVGNVRYDGPECLLPA